MADTKQVVEAWLEDDAGSRKDFVVQGERSVVKARVRIV